MDHEQTYDRRPRRRGRKLLIGFVVLLLVLAGLVVIADRVAASVAERTIADEVRQQVARQHAQSSPPEVEVGGFPFLTQVVDGRYERITIRMRDVQGAVQGDAISLPSLDVDARNVRASLDTLRTGQGDVVAETVNGTATISYQSLAALLDREGLTLGERNGQLAVTAPWTSSVSSSPSPASPTSWSATRGRSPCGSRTSTPKGCPAPRWPVRC